MSYYLIIAGPIGVGKSTLTARMQQSAGYFALFEEPDDNPYLQHFYASGASAFETQLSFLGQRLHQCARIADHLGLGRRVVQDRSIEEDFRIFTEHAWRKGLISTPQFEIYQSLYSGMQPFLPKADLVIYLAAPVEVLQRRIRARGRAYEQQLGERYLQEQNDLYEAWAENYDRTPMLRIDTAQYDDAGQVFRQAMLRLGLPVTEVAV